MPLLRLLAVAAAALVVAGSASAPASAYVSSGQRDAATAAALHAPTGLRGFLPEIKTAGFGAEDVFSRTPAFAWNPTRGASRYELMLSTSSAFRSNGVIWDDASMTTPVAAVPIALPWITGSPHSLYARVRAVNRNGSAGPWSGVYGFDVRWTTGVPQQLPAPSGLIRWTPVPGATSYEVWYLNAPSPAASPGGNGAFTAASGTPATPSPDVFSTTINVADEREYYPPYQRSGWNGAVAWRIRAVREVYGPLANALPRVSYGPWSDAYTSATSPLGTGQLTGLATVADPPAGGAGTAPFYEYTPGFVFAGSAGLAGAARLHRVYVFTDRDCVNDVFDGLPVGSPAYAPRTDEKWARLPAGFDILNDLVPARELQDPATFDFGTGTSGGSASPGSPAPPASSTSGSSGTGAPASTLATHGAPIGLWDSDGPSSNATPTGRYYWTVVTTSDASTDTELPQDVCQRTTRWSSFGIASQDAAPVDPATSAPFARGLSQVGSLAVASAQRRTFYGTPLVTWLASREANAYEVQWTKSPNSSGTKDHLYTFATATTLPLKPGRWYYRVRGINMSLPTGASTMAWSQWVRIVIAKPTFKVVGG